MSNEVVVDFTSPVNPKIFNESTFELKAAADAKKFINSFVLRKDFEGKRFQRFVTKTKESLREHADGEQNLVSMIKEALNIYIFSSLNQSEDITKEFASLKLLCSTSFINMIWKNRFDSEIFNKFPIEVLNQFFSGSNNAFGFSLSDMIEKEFREACKYYIMLNHFFGKIEESTYMQCVPKFANEVILFWQIWLNGCIISLQQKCCTVLEYKEEEDSFNQIQDCLKETKEKLKKTEQTLKQKDQILEEKDHIISSLKNETEKLRNQQADKKLQKKYSELYHEKEVLQKKYQQLQEKINKKKEIIVSETKKEEKKSSKRLNKNLRYMFIVNSNIYLAKNIEEQFPNSTTKIKNLTPQMICSVDAVVFITGNIKHTPYHRARNLCKNMGVPYVHSAKLNIDQIILDMENALKDDKFFLTEG